MSDIQIGFADPFAPVGDAPEQSPGVNLRSLRDKIGLAPLPPRALARIRRECNKFASPHRKARGLRMLRERHIAKVVRSWPTTAGEALRRGLCDMNVPLSESVALAREAEAVTFIDQRCGGRFRSVCVRFPSNIAAVDCPEERVLPIPLPKKPVSDPAKAVICSALHDEVFTGVERVIEKLTPEAAEVVHRTCRQLKRVPKDEETNLRRILLEGWALVGGAYSDKQAASVRTGEPGGELDVGGRDRDDLQHRAHGADAATEVLDVGGRDRDDLQGPPIKTAADKARAVYEFAMSEIPEAANMTRSDLHAAVIEHCELKIASSNAPDHSPSDFQRLLEWIPDNPETFARYLRMAGVRRYGPDGLPCRPKARRTND
jgi:hypothetical protein